MPVLFEKMSVCSEITEKFMKKHTDEIHSRKEFRGYEEHTKDLFDSSLLSFVNFVEKITMKLFPTLQQ